MAGVGHNSGFAKEHLKSFVERIEKLNEEKDAIGEDVKSVYSEAKGIGFDTKILRNVIRLRKLDKAARQEMQSITELYMNALGMLD